MWRIMTDKLTCDTCNHIDKTSYRHYYCTLGKNELEGEDLAFLARVGCKSHSNNRCIPITDNKMCEMCSKSERADERTTVLDELRDRLDTIRRAYPPHNVISFKKVHQIIQSLRQGGKDEI